MKRLKLAETLSSNEKDPLVRRAIQYQATIGCYYSRTGAALTRAIANRGVPWSQVPAKADKAILSATLRYLETCHPVLIQVIREDVLKGLFADIELLLLRLLTVA